MSVPSTASNLLKRSVIDFLRRHAPFSQLDAGHLDLLAEHASLNYFPGGTRILGPADGMPGRYYIVHRGEVHSAPPGQFATDAGGVAAMHPGESFPLGALVEGRVVVNDYVASRDTFCYEFDKAAFDALLAKSPAFAAFCTRRIAHLLQESRRQARAQAQEDAHARHNMTSLVSTLLRKPAVTCNGNTPLRDALLVMRDQRIGSMVAIDAANRAVGILTERDVLDRIVLEGMPLDIPFASVMTPRPHTIEESATAFDAILLMARHAIRHLPVTRGGELVGVVSERDLFAVQRASMRDVGRAINQAADGSALEQAAADVRKLARNLQLQGMAIDQLTQLVVALNDRLVERAIEIVRRDTGLDGHDACWIALGSEGRMEQTVSTDQDNGLVFEAQPGESLETCAVKRHCSSSRRGSRPGSTRSRRRSR
jgi:CBS domain-containing protein